MPQVSDYVRITTVHDTKNASCGYARVQPDGQLKEVTASAFNNARRRGKSWSQVITFDEGWKVSEAQGQSILVVKVPN